MDLYHLLTAHVKSKYRCKVDSQYAADQDFIVSSLRLYTCCNVSPFKLLLVVYSLPIVYFVHDN